MIEQLTIEKLTAYGFNETFIENLQNWEGYECFCHNDKGTFWASNTEQKIYSGIEASRKKYFKGNYIAFPYEDLELVPEYYELRRSRFIEEQRKIAGTIFNENIAKERFRKNEILITEKNIRENEQLRMMPSLAIRAEKLRHYLIWLNELKENVEIRSNTNSPLSPFDNFLNELLKLEVRVTEYYYNDYGYEEDCTPAEFPALKEIPGMNYKIGKYLDLKHYTQSKRDYENKLKELQQLALTYLLNFEESQIKQQLTRLEQFEESMDKCLGHYLEFNNAFLNKTYWSITDLEMKIYAGLIVPQHEYGIISERFVFDLHDALMFKNAFLAGFISQVKRVLGIEETLPNLESTETESENDFTLSTIEDWLFQFKEKMSQSDYSKLVSALNEYFKTGGFPEIDKTINVGKVNKKLFGWNLNSIYRAIRNNALPKEYLLFFKENVSLFSDVKFDENDILNSNLYKYFTTKTK